MHKLAEWHQVVLVIAISAVIDVACALAGCIKRRGHQAYDGVGVALLMVAQRNANQRGRWLAAVGGVDKTVQQDVEVTPWQLCRQQRNGGFRCDNQRRAGGGQLGAVPAQGIRNAAAALKFFILGNIALQQRNGERHAARSGWAGVALREC